MKRASKELLIKFQKETLFMTIQKSALKTAPSRILVILIDTIEYNQTCT
jgi:hypothetical protein